MVWPIRSACCWRSRPFSSPMSRRMQVGMPEDGLPARRHGYEDGWIWYNGRKLGIKRPRARTAVGGSSCPATTASRHGAARSVMKRVLARVSMRRYGAALEAAAEGHGIDKSSISRHWKAASAEKLAALLARPLGGIDLTAIMIDGVGFGDETIVVALGISVSGRKHVLGLMAGTNRERGAGAEPAGRPGEPWVGSSQALPVRARRRQGLAQGRPRCLRCERHRAALPGPQAQGTSSTSCRRSTTGWSLPACVPPGA